MVRLPPLKQGSDRRKLAARGRNTSVPLQSSVGAARRAAPIYWQLHGDTAPLYHGPLGDVVGEVPSGTVIRELQRYMDPFGSWWVALKASEGGTVWALLSTVREIVTHDDYARWQRVYDKGVVAQGSSEPDWQNEAAVLRRAVIPVEVNSRVVPSNDAVLRELRLLEEGWRSLSAVCNKGPNWNAEYQRLVELILFGRWDQSVSASDELHTFMREFVKAAEEAALKVITDMQRPPSDRVTKGPIHGTLDSFLYNNLLVRFVLDDGSGNYNGDADAWRQASQVIQAMRLIALEGSKRLLYSPPSALITFCGFRCLVMGIPPLEVKNIVHLVSLKEQEYALDTPELVKSQLQDLGQALGLKKQNVKLATGDVIPVAMPLGMPVVAGHDKRLYVVITSPFLPTCELLISGKDNADGAATLRFRPEFLLSYGKPLSPHAFVHNAASPEDNADVMEATEWVRDALIPAVAAIIGLHQAVDVPRQDPVPCTLCARMMENELRFVVCRSIDRCCCICSHCYTQRLSEERKNSRLFSNAVKCGTTARGPKGLLLQPSVTTIFHAHGLNMRFLPFVYYRIPQAARFAVAHYCEVEMIARTAVRLLREKLRRTAQGEDEVKTVCQEFLLGLLQSSGAKAKQFWKQELGPALESLYGVQVPFDTSELDVELLYFHVARLSGVYLHMESAASFHTDKPFLQLAEVTPVTKTIQPPLLGDEVSHAKRRAALMQRLEDVLLFWIGFAAEGNDDAEVDSTQPFYLSEGESGMQVTTSMFH
ncbi:hypothetical protein TraAM80_04047 [Trypanosoma rangeli]|uniref:Clu domain-containing protein n=1 Tax=Trypanosoma rangeli TaxID=5698 RepID=A0A422NLC9_TRYRA|nr:uncharacterized protein TraAM80_04047 [Trypanosoma rangeli]RNF06224.1 hypothetical protein TraAM80_04047 [Trypanosoma rangeli]|eukprot:RNF06224.1 hypothetical protein TraAM80_04047 [Trypanosoma rangeli]